MRNKNFFYWLPRILTIIFTCFLALFALDVFIPGKTIDYYLVALFIHLIPNFILLLALFVAWKNDKLGGVIFLLIGIVTTIIFKSYSMPTSLFIVSFPILLIGILFVVNSYIKRTKIR